MSADEKKTGRRGAGRGRRQTPARQEQLPGQEPGEPGIPGTPETPIEAPGRGRGRGRMRAAMTESIPSPEGSPEGVSPKGSPHGSDVEEKMKKMDIVTLASRPGFGVAGQKVQVLANFFEVRLDKELTVVQYHVDVNHERMRLNREDKHRIFWTAVQQNPGVFPNHRRLLYDGDHICISLDRLVFGPGQNGESTGRYEVRLRLMRMERAEPFTVVFQAVGLIHVNMRETRSAAASAERYTTPQQVFDLMIRQHRRYPLDDATTRDWFCFANTVYKIPPGGNGTPLTAGRVIWQGLFGASRVGQGYTPFINFDIIHSGFYKPQSVLQYLVDILNEKFKSKEGPFSLQQLNAETVLGAKHVMEFDKAMRGMKVRMRVRTANGEEVEREYPVNAVIRRNAVQHSFEQRMPEGQGRMVTVAQYFAERYGQLRYPKLNLLHVGPRKKEVYVPMEHCTIPYNQRLKKLNSDDTSSMIRAAAISAPQRKQKVDELVRQSAFANDPWLREFGVRVSPQMKTVEARVLTPPKIHYGRNGASRQGSVVEVREGTWDVRGQKFFVPGSCKHVGALILDDRDTHAYTGFFNFLLRTCLELGMNVPPNVPQQSIAVIPPKNIAGIEGGMTKLKSLGCDFVIVTLPQKSSTHYSEVKRVAEITVGMMTQCVVKQNVMNCMQGTDRMTTTNIALKMNMKMGGVNSVAAAETLAKKTLQEQATLVLGIDVTHPAPTERRMPSISSVVGNIDDTFMRYAASIRVQKRGRESVAAGHLDQLVRERLSHYHNNVIDQNRKTGGNKPTDPSRIIIFRDGVAEGQFQEILHDELGGVRDACKGLHPDYRPKVTLIVAQKRHHTRFFPTQGGPSSGKALNVWPGTVVDRDITHPELFEYYLCSHLGIQGTSRPIRYHVLHDDNGFSADHLQAMTFYLCHVYARCTRAVSIPAPVYYADLACRRARAHLFHKVADFDSDTLSQRSGAGGGETETAVSEDDLIKSSTVLEPLNMTMYFV